MTDFLYDPLETEIAMKIQPEANCLLRGFRPSLLRSGSPAGLVRLELRDALGQQIIKASSDRSAAAIGTGSHWAGDAGFILEAALRGGVTYQLVLVARAGYAHSSSDHLGWCLDFLQDRKTRLGYTEAGHDQSPYGLELWPIQEATRGVRYGY